MSINLNDKKIAILGFGKDGQATFNYLIKNGFKVSAVLDQNNQPDQSVQELLKSHDVSYVGGDNYMNQLNDFDVIFRAPGIPRLHPKLVSFKEQDNIYSHTKLFFDLCPCPIVAVTGTKGKTTTSSLIYSIIKSTGRQTFLGGNIGEPPLNFLSNITPESIVVLEVSSFQAQDLHKSPHVAVILNITHDHLDDGTFRAASHQTQDEYVNSKLQLLVNQTTSDFAVVHPALKSRTQSLGQGVKIYIDPAKYSTWKRAIPGTHNLENIAAAVEACMALGITPEEAQLAVAEFSGVDQRLQTIANKNDVTYVNDSASTNPDSTVAAIKSFNQPIILIAGGSDKNLDYDELAQTIKNASNVKAVILIGAIAPALKSLLNKYEFSGEIIQGELTMPQIIEQARSKATAGDVVLLSPAAASFDMFKNSKDRGEQFNSAVALL